MIRCHAKDGQYGTASLVIFGAWPASIATLEWQPTHFSCLCVECYLNSLDRSRKILKSGCRQLLIAYLLVGLMSNRLTAPHTINESQTSIIYKPAWFRQGGTVFEIKGEEGPAIAARSPRFGSLRPLRSWRGLQPLLLGDALRLLSNPASWPTPVPFSPSNFQQHTTQQLPTALLTPYSPTPLTLVDRLSVGFHHHNRSSTLTTPSAESPARSRLPPP